MRASDYQWLAMRTSNRALSPQEHLINGVLGLCGEAGEVADIIKKHHMQGHDLDVQHVAKELGDVCWYLAETASAIGYDLSHIMQANIEKLKARYPDGFDAERSINRAEGDI